MKPTLFGAMMIAFSMTLGSLGCLAQLGEADENRYEEESIEREIDPLVVNQPAQFPTSDVAALVTFEEGWHGWEASFNGAPGGVTSVSLAQGPIGGALEVFATTNGTLYHNFLNNSGWHGWEANFNGAPSSVRSVSLAQGPIGGALEVFAVTAGGTLFHNFLNNSGWHGWNSSFDGAPSGVTSVALAKGPIGGALEVFAVTAGGTLYHNFLNDSGWHGWSPSFDGAPSGVTSVALAQGPIGGALEVFAVTAGGTLYHNFLNDSGWHGWEVNFNGAPDGVTSVALAQGPIGGALEVFAIANGTLYRNFLNNSGWHGWAPSFDGAPSGVTSVALARGPIGGELEVFATANGTLYHNFLSNSGWHGWRASFDGAPGGVTSVALAQGPIGGNLEVFAIANGTLYHNFLNTSLAAPSNVRVTGTTSNSVSLAWTDNSAIETGFQITNVQSGSVKTTAANATSVTVGSLSASTNHCFDVRAVNGSGSSPAVRVCATTPAPAPQTVLVLLHRVITAQGNIYYSTHSVIRGTITRIRVPSQFPVTVLLFPKPGLSAATVCPNPQPGQVVVAPVNTDVDLTALFGSPTVPVNGPDFVACALVSRLSDLWNVVVEITYVPAP